MLTQYVFKTRWGVGDKLSLSSETGEGEFMHMLSSHFICQLLNGQQDGRDQEQV